MRSTGTILLLAVLLVVGSAERAFAYTVANVGTSSANSIYVGLVRRASGTSCNTSYAGGGTCPSDTGTHNYACVRGSSPTSSATWFYLGNGIAGLYDDYGINAAGGSDFVKIFTSSGNLPAGDTCRGYANWNDPTYNSHYVDLLGGDGDDILSSGDVDTWLFGEGYNDTLWMYDSGGQLNGGNNDDILYGLTTDEDFAAGSGNDCAYDTGSYYGGDGGSGTDYWWGPAPCPTNFTYRITSGDCSRPTVTGC